MAARRTNSASEVVEEAVAEAPALDVSAVSNNGDIEYLVDDRHVSTIGARSQGDLEEWRMKERMKTTNVLVVLCLNIGVDPPDVVKTSPCARLECWLDPLSLPPQKCLDAVGLQLVQQYSRWQNRARYKRCLDPTLDELKKFCQSLRRSAKKERGLLHYNGHGVPRPSESGEVWVFNPSYTQYIPVSMYDILTWVEAPTIFLFDCSAAGRIVNAFESTLEQLAEDRGEEDENGALIPKPLAECMVLAACSAHETLPMNPDLPADVFTSCLTTPLKMALRWFCTHSTLVDVPLELVDAVPGQLQMRRTPLGELNWIFTAVTDTIAWSVLPRDLFQKLFRQDLLLASLYRNYLLAERIMRSANCTPISVPRLPPTYNHPMWQAWDLAVDACLSQLPGLLSNPPAEYVHSSFFTDQLTAFEVWLSVAAKKKASPSQLPIVLQVLLSQVHRKRALELLARFLSLGPWAVNLALSVGIFPYVLKLLQSPETGLREVLVTIWARILALDRSCQVDLAKDTGYMYFVNVLSSQSVSPDVRSRAAFVLALLVADYEPGQQRCLQSNLLGVATAWLSAGEPLLRRWLCLCLGQLWTDHEEAKRLCLRETTHEAIAGLILDRVPEVRAAAVFALGTLFGGDRTDARVAMEQNVTYALLQVLGDASPMVRVELVVALSRFVAYSLEDCVAVATAFRDADLASRSASPTKKATKGRTESTESAASSASVTPISGAVPSTTPTVYSTLWQVMLGLTLDPFPHVAEKAARVVNAINDMVPPPADSEAPSGRSRAHALSSSNSNGEGGTRGPASTGMSSEELFEARQRVIATSDFFDWSIRPEQLMTDAEKVLLEEEPDAEAEWRRVRNDNVMRSVAEEHTAGAASLDDQVALLDNEAHMAMHLAFDSYENTVVVADGGDAVSIWNYDDATRAAAFRNGNAPGSRITSLCVMNDAYKPVLVVGTDEGVVRLWKDYCESSRPRLLTAWRALAELQPGGRGAGLISDWQQHTGRLLASGDVGVVRVWDVTMELAIQDLPTGSSTCVTSLSSSADGAIVVGGCGDGTVRMFDLRLPPRECLVTTFNEHTEWVVNVHLQKGGRQELVSGSLTGDVRFWDPRLGASAKTIMAHSNGMTALAVHDYAPNIATGAHSQSIKVFNTDGTTLSTIRYHDGFLGQRIGPVSCLAFHPYSLLLASGSTDAIVSVYTTNTRARPGSMS